MAEQQISTSELGKITAYNEWDEAIQLSELWAKNNAVLLFVRHFG